MRIPQLLLGLVIASGVLLALAAALPASPDSAPAPHPVHASMLVGGEAPSTARIAIGWAFGAVQIAFFGACFALGMLRGGRLGPVARPLALGLLVYGALWTALVVSYAANAGDPQAPLWGSFPRPTAWMLYGLWPFPLVFAFLYVRHFDGWFLNECDFERFRARLAELEAAAEDREAARAPRS